MKMVNLKCCEIHELKNNKIIESYILIDLIDLLIQIGLNPLKTSRGSEGSWLSPINTDGVNFFEKDMQVSKASLEQSLIMQRSLNIKPELEVSFDKDLKERLINHPQNDYWHDKMVWYGPSGIGTARTLEGFVDNHQLPFRKTFKERNYWELGHYCEIGDGKFSLTAGWNSIQAIYNANPQKTSYEDALEIIDEIQNSIDHSGELKETSYSNTSGELEFKSNFTKNEYMSSVNKIKEYIKEGDVMQVVLAQDFYQSFEGDSFELYSALRQINPSPYMYYLNLDECEVVGSSPEILVRLEDSNITLRPIAGTRKRGANEEEDKNNEKDLLNDPKELAEHLMLIDLGRNDVGRVSEIGSVKLTEKMVIERYSHVMHIVSNVVGKLSRGLNFTDALKATLPAGTLSGAPKIRAMEIINELEPSSRGIYGGAIGYISWNGNIDTAIAIRTAVIRDNKIHVGAGAGIVADSDPEKEWEECVQKSKVFLDAMEMIS